MSTNVSNTASPDAVPPWAGAGIQVENQEVIEQLRKEIDKSNGHRDQRTAERKPWVTQLTLLIADPLGKSRTVNVSSHDISTGGFSFIYKQFVHINTKVRAQFESLPGRPSLNGVVRSCIHVGGMHHRVGVQFATTNSIPKEKPKSSPNS